MGPAFSLNGTSDSTFLALYQVAAKIQETLCIASLATVVLQILRHELIHGEGVPIGLLGSGLSFSSVSYFWSPEFVSAAKYCLTSWKRCRLYFVVTLAGALAVFIGPASAVLLLPRVQTIKAGETQYYLNGTADQFWPSVVTSSSEYMACVLPNSTRYAVCPSGGYYSLRSDWLKFNYTNQLDSYIGGSRHAHQRFYATQLEAAGGLAARNFSILNQSPLAMLPAMITSGSLDGVSPETFAIQPHGATTAIQQQLDTDWFNTAFNYPTTNTSFSSLAEYKYVSHFKSSTTTTIPLVRTRCSSIAINLTSDADEISFPYLHNGAQWADDYKNASISSLNRSSSTHLRAQWLSLPVETFGPVSTGLLFELPWTSSLDSRVAIGCTVSAVWAPGMLTSDSVSSQYAWSSQLLADYTQARILDNLNASSPTANRVHRLITLDPSWLIALTPPAPDAGFQDGDWIPNTMEQIISDTHITEFFDDYRTRAEMYWLDGQCKMAYTDQNWTQVDMWNDLSCGKGNKRILLESIITVGIADGLSRFGSSRVYNTAPDLRDWSLQASVDIDVDNNALLQGKQAVQLPSDPNLVIQTMRITIDGYAYNASSITDYLSTAVICIYMLVTSLHTIWILWHRVTSSSWDTVTELISLCLNSTPTHVLDNTSPGIQRFGTYTKVVKIRAVRLENGTDQQRLSLLFRDDDHSAYHLVEIDKKYN